MEILKDLENKNEAVLFGRLDPCGVETINLKNSVYKVIYLLIPKKRNTNNSEKQSYDRVRLVFKDIDKHVLDLMGEGKEVRVTGELGAYNVLAKDDNKTSTFLCVNVFNIEDATNLEKPKNPNDVKIMGRLCKKAVSRVTPKGKVITDLLIGLNDADGEDIYVYCVVWDAIAERCTRIQVGDFVSVWGRIESRDYVKKLEDGTLQKRVAYEVSGACVKWYQSTEK